MSSETKDLNPAPSSVDAPAPAAAAAGNDFIPSIGNFKGFIIFAVILAIVFCRPLLALIEFAPHQELYSHILLIPFISAYFIWLKRRERVPQSQPNRARAALPLILGAAVLGVYGFGLRQGWNYTTPDYLAAMVLAFLFFLLGGAFLFVQRLYLKSITFPVAFMFFCVPFPKAVRGVIETFFQYGSADAAYGMLKIAGMSVFKVETDFVMPAFRLNVQPECSGIHSTLVLLITSVLASYLFLRKPMSRGLFVLFVIPLALLRNGFRVFCLAEIGVHWDPTILDSWFHHRGGPLFFLLSLVPLFLLLKYLIRWEAPKQQSMTDK
jgi:exosortase C (VPDSG-CTERM-specific)